MFIFGIFPLNKLLLVRVFPKSEFFRNDGVFNVFNSNKILQMVQLLLIFVDILPKLGAVHFAEFFH